MTLRLPILACVAAIAGIVSGEEPKGTAISGRLLMCIDSERSVIWKTVMDFPLTVPISWPDGAQKAVLTVAGAESCNTTAEITDTTVTAYEIAASEPRSESEECVLSLTLSWYGSDGTELVKHRKTAQLGVVRGVESPVARVVFAGEDSRQWRRAPANPAVVQISAGATALTVNGSAPSEVAPDEWKSVRLENGSENQVELICGEEILFRTVAGPGRSMTIIVK